MMRRRFNVAKTKINYKKLARMQEEMEERMEKQRRNKNNWSGAVFTPKKPKDIADADDIIFYGQNHQRG